MMRLLIAPQPTPEEAQAIATAIEVLLTRAGPTPKKLRFNDAALARKDWDNIRRSGMNVCGDTHPQDFTWRDMARIEALTPGV